AFLPPIRNILVAPGFLEPVERGSGNFIALAVIIAAETDPIR
ncbi:MAG: hypothetical protein RLZZ422_2609, partial [Pseudomonadota bacterium]